MKIRRQWRQVASGWWRVKSIGWHYGVVGPLRGDGVLRSVRLNQGVALTQAGECRLGVSHASVAGADALESAADLVGPGIDVGDGLEGGFALTYVGRYTGGVDVPVERRLGGGSWYVHVGFKGYSATYPAYFLVFATMEGDEYVEEPAGVASERGVSDGKG